METSTARIMEALALYGPGPLAPEDDPLDGDRDFAGAMAGLLNHLADALTNSALETHTEDIAWGLVNLFHRKVMRLERDLDGLEIECQGLAASQDGSEVRSVELERATARAGAIADHAEAFEAMRARLAAEFAELTGSSWRPRAGSTRRGALVTSAMIDAKDFLAARRQREAEANAPRGPLIGFSGGADWIDADAVFRVLDKIRGRHPEMVLAHTAQDRGADLIAARWAQTRGVDQIAFRPQFHLHAKAAPFRRNDAMIEAGLAGCVIFRGNGVTLNLGQKAEKAGVSVLRCGFVRE